MSSPSSLTPELASLFARIALGHVAREYPNKLDHVLTGPDEVRGPRELHPIFFGSFDWHSCVHGYWTLATVLRRYPDIREAGEIRDLFDETFTAEKVAVETGYVLRPWSRGFERPYGWAWLLMLQAELLRHDARWATIHQPLADAFERRFLEFLPLAHYPIRTGVHSSTAFALRLAWDYPSKGGLRDLIRERAQGWHAADRDANAWEPSLDDFLSPTLMTASLMSRVIDRDAFPAWFDTYLPGAAAQSPTALFTPAVPPDRTDGKMAHLDGVNLSRAWCWREIAAALPEGHAVRPIAEASARTHLAAALPHVVGDYMGEHWLASFALLALTAG